MYQTTPQNPPAAEENLLDALLLDKLPSTQDTFSLDDLLSESVKYKEQKEEEKELRKKQARGGLPKAEAALIRKWELQREWDATANVLVFQRQRCSFCGSYHNLFDGLFELHTHKRLAITRTVAVKFHEKSLPKAVRYTDSDTAICHNCADKQAEWELEDDTADEVVRVYKSQEEINAENLERIAIIEAMQAREVQETDVYE